MATAAAAVGAAIRKVVSHLMSANAVSPESAITFVPERHIQRRVLARMVRRGVIVEAGEDRYYVDVPAYDRWRRRVRLRAGLALGAVGIAALLAGVLA